MGVVSLEDLGPIPDWRTSPETMLIAREEVEQLSPEAKTILQLVWDLPWEVRRTLNKTKLKQLLRMLEWKHITIQLAFKELKEWANRM